MGAGEGLTIMKNSRITVFVALFLTALLFGTVGFSLIEGLAFLDALYFSVVTVATVGYGDIVPKTTAGRMLAIAMIVMGVGAFTGVVANGAEMVLNRRDRQLRRQKMNMIVGIFFSEAGVRLLGTLLAGDRTIEDIRGDLIVQANWTKRQFALSHKRLRDYTGSIDVRSYDLEEIRSFLQDKGELILRIFENPNLLEHESFTEMLRAVLHVKEELLSRHDLGSLPQTDLNHLATDFKRAYIELISEWLHYMEHLKAHYPYLFSLAIRKNPFDRQASVVVR